MNDLAIYRAGTPIVEALASPSDGGLLVAGIARLAQIVIIALLTELGSKPFKPKDGTTFMIDAGQGRWRTPVDVIQSFNLAQVGLARQIRQDELNTDPPAERYGSVNLADVNISIDAVTIQLVVTSLAGTSLSLEVPVPFTY